ncbi:glucosamine-6-phosphate deaminase [Lysinibacillus composti]|uniref:Glucosamine-6-phosphate deaminase n=1 Tax=Lysinibacillus composti TaxID=720633 RepID=A0A3N9UU54_9BACI|nr:glucosamine-6-phosphate deaminase [Lysinibacillus composti]MBM7607444.1 glucosamine-6-phosphate deaminase [Lysinibacillus composti]RQW76002.1 glucosamine-6-phosphate deaminase [Lysinibacillus composti]
MEIIQVKDYEEMSKTACFYLLKKVGNIEQPVLGLATGSTPEGLYRQLIEAYKNGSLSFKNVKTFNLDEYIHLDQTNPNSYYYYMKKHLFDWIDIPKEQIHLPNGKAQDLEAECLDYENKIKQVGKIDIQILGIGLNGHIGFNEPGTAFTSRTHVIALDESTREANAKFFPSIDDVPTHAITMGIETIMESEEILLLASGEQKAAALNRLLNGEISEEFPASILHRHKKVTVIADAADVN